MANQGGGHNNVLREYRKGNWTVQETMVLIEAKRMDDERRTRRQGESGERGKPAELRWKWVEDYCWRNGCMRSQNQCNDKWDNLMRDFKKVREYERKVSEKTEDQEHHHHQHRGGGGDVEEEKSYWNLEKNERKAKNLPSNMLPQIYEALLEVVERKGQRVIVGAAGAGRPASTSDPMISTTLGQSSMPSMPPTIQQYTIPAAPVSALPLPSPAQHPFSQPFPAVGSDSDTSEHSDSPAKRRRRRRRRGGGEGSSSGTNTHHHEVGSAISKSASIIAEAIQSCEEREERRHRELLNLHQRRLQIEESKAEISRQGINGLVDAVNKLANSILALAAHKTQAASK